jgi:hypothetical protein
MELLDFNYDASCIWFLSTVLNIFHDVWEYIENKVVERCNWYGWYLHYVCRYKLIPRVVSKRGKKDTNNPYVYRPNQNVCESTLGLMLLMSKEMSDDKPEYFCQSANNFVELLTSISNNNIMSKKVNSCRSSFQRSKLWDLKVNDDVKYVVCYKSDEMLTNVCLDDEIVLTSEN